MEHPISSTELVRPWRTATLVATAIAALELVLLVIAGLILLGRSLSPQVQAAAERETTAKPAVAATKPPAATKPARRTPAAMLLPRSRTSVLVLNGNGVQGAAAGAASLAKARGYPVADVGNAPRTSYARTIVMYRPSREGEAKRFAKDLNLGLVGPLDGMKPAQLHGAKLVLIVGAQR